MQPAARATSAGLSFAFAEGLLLLHRVIVHPRGWKKIPCVVVKLKSILAGEWAENEMRKQFTKSEREAIAEAAEKECGSDGKTGSRGPKSSANADDPVGRSVDIAAKSVGFSTETYGRVKSVVDRGTPELITAMDKGEIKIDAAAKIASQPKTSSKT